MEIENAPHEAPERTEVEQVHTIRAQVLGVDPEALELALVKDMQPNTIQAPQHVLPCPCDLALGAPPLKRLPTRVLALLIACNPPRRPLPAAHPHAIPHLARRLRLGFAIRLLRTRRLSNADACGVFFFERNEGY